MGSKLALESSFRLMRDQVAPSLKADNCSLGILLGPILLFYVQVAALTRSVYFKLQLVFF